MDGHTFTVVLTPDLEDGGFTVQCKEEPAAISQGKTKQEAIDNIIDALELCLEHEREFQASKSGRAAGSPLRVGEVALWVFRRGDRGRLIYMSSGFWPVA